MNTELIPVFSGTLNNESVLLCDARKLHAKLQIGRRFATWIVERIKEYGFVENQDFIAISQKREIGSGRGRTDYHLTLDTAKELAMVEKNEIGRQIRRYFIECENRLLSMIEPMQLQLMINPVVSIPFDTRQNAEYRVIVKEGKIRRYIMHANMLGQDQGTPWEPC